MKYHLDIWPNKYFLRLKEDEQEKLKGQDLMEKKNGIKMNKLNEGRKMDACKT